MIELCLQTSNTAARSYAVQYYGNTFGSPDCKPCITLYRRVRYFNEELEHVMKCSCAGLLPPFNAWTRDARMLGLSTDLFKSHARQIYAKLLNTFSNLLTVTHIYTISMLK